MPKGKPPKVFQGVHARLVFPEKEDERAVLDLMRRFSSATRFAYNRLLEGKDRKELKREDGHLCGLFGLKPEGVNQRKEPPWHQFLAGPEGRPMQDRPYGPDPSPSWARGAERPFAPQARPTLPLITSRIMGGVEDRPRSFSWWGAGVQ